MTLRPGQRTELALLLAWNFCAVAAIAIGRTVSNALFLAHETAARQPIMFIVSPAVVVMVGIAHASLADRVRRHRLVLVTPLVLAALVVAAWSSLGPRWIYYALYAGVEVIVSVTMIQFWTSAGERFSPREARQLFSRIAIGGTVANITLGFVMSALVRRTGTEVWLLVTASFLVAVALLAGVVTRRPGARTSPKASTRTPAKTSPSRAAHSVPATDPPGTRHLVLLAPMIACTVLATTLLEFQFKTIGGHSFGGDREAWGHFLGQIQGAMGLLSLFMQLFVTGKVLDRVGVTGALMFMPGTLGLSAAGILVSPTLPPATVSEFGDVFRFTVHDAATQLLYLPVPAAVRGRRKATIDGVIKPVTEAMSGGGLFLYQQASTALAPLAAVSVAVVTIYFALVLRMRVAYARSLAETLHHRRITSAGADDVTARDVERVVRAALRGSDPAEIRRALDLARLAPGALGPELRALTTHADPTLRAQALSALAAGNLPVDDATIAAALAHPDPDVRAAGARAAGAGQLAVVSPFLDAPEASVATAAAEAMFKHGDPAVRARVIARVTALLVGTDPVARRLGLDLALRVGDPALLPAVIARFGDRRDGRMAAEAAAVMARTSTDAQRVLEDCLERPSDAPAAVRALGRTGSPTALARVVDALASPDEAVRDAACEALARARAEAPEVNLRTVQLVAACDADLARAYGAIAAAEGLGHAESTLLPDGTRRLLPYRPADVEGPAALISRALRERGERARDRVLNLLGALQPDMDVVTIRANLDEPDPVRRANAVELLEAIGWNGAIARLKPLVLALVDDSPRHGKLTAARRLSLPTRTRDGWVASLLDDPSPWMVTCAAYYAGAAGVIAARPRLEALSHDPREVVRETAAAALVRMDMDGMDGPGGTDVTDASQTPTAREPMITTAEKVLFLKGIELFAAVPSEDLAELARIATELALDESEAVFAEGDRGDALYFIVEGRVRVETAGRTLAELGEREVFGEMALLDPAPRSATATAITSVTLLRIGQDDFSDVLRERPEVAAGVLRVMTRRLRAANHPAQKSPDTVP